MSAKKSESCKLHQYSLPKSLQNISNSTYPVLSGIFWIGAYRLSNFPVNQTFVLNCKRFWSEEELSLYVSKKVVNFLETFSVNLDKHFLEKVESNNLCINLASINNCKQNVFGLLRIPLHQFFIAYRDEDLTNRLCNAELPVFSTDAWVPIFDSNYEKLGEIECVLAMGTKKQINNVKISRGWESQKSAVINKCEIDEIDPNSEADSISRTSSKVRQIKTNVCIKSPISVGENAAQTETENTVNYVPEMFESICSSLPHPCITRLSEGEKKIAEPLRIYMEIKMAKDLPTNPPINSKHICKRSTANKEKHIRFPPGEEPNTYVTFQASVGSGLMVKSHEGMVYTTSIIEKSSNPAWNESFTFSLKLDYLMNKSKTFILKVWKKSSSISSSKSVPTPLEDKILGFVAIDLTVLLKNTYVSDWYNIMNCFGHTNGQLKLTVQCLDELDPLEHLSNDHDNQVDNLLDSFEAGLSINNFNLSRAIKRKFTELEEISRRLRTRLLDVTNNTEYTNDLEGTDEYTKEFEHDLNTVVYEDDREPDFSNNASHALRILDNPNP